MKFTENNKILPPPPRFADRAFTLAEVLITLAIIGVVAALTIPAVVANYQKQQYVTQLKKEYSNINNAFHLYLLSEGVADFSQTKMITSLSGITPTDETWAELLRILKISEYGTMDNVENNTYKYLKESGGSRNFGATYYYAILADGATIYFSNFSKEEVSYDLKEKIHKGGGKFFNSNAFVWIDVNGFSKKPNQFGRDLFLFHLGQDGTLYPRSGKDYAIKTGSGALSENVYWKDATSATYTCETKTSYGVACAARIMEEDWKMTY